MEHRWGQRVPCQVHVWIALSIGTGGTGRLRDVSLSGAFVESTLAIPLASHIVLTVLGDGATRNGEVQIRGNVVRVQADGVGIEWSEAPERSICAVLGCTSRCIAH